MDHITQQGQTLWDIAIQRCGSSDAAFDIARLNNLNVTDEPQPGEVILLPHVRNSRITAYYCDNQIKPATWVNKKEGIGHWQIETDFIVS